MGHSGEAECGGRSRECRVAAMCGESWAGGRGETEMRGAEEWDVEGCDVDGDCEGGVVRGGKLRFSEGKVRKIHYLVEYRRVVKTTAQPATAQSLPSPSPSP